MKNTFLINSTKKTIFMVGSGHVRISQVTDNNMYSFETISINSNIAKQMANCLLDVNSKHTYFQICSGIDINIYHHHNIVVIERVVTITTSPPLVSSIVLTDNEAQEIALFIKGKLQ